MADVDTGHDYDGIREFDNPLPNWWLATLYGAVVFALGYWLYYQTFQMPGLVATLAAEQAEAARIAGARAPVTDDLLIALSHDAQVIEKAQATFKTQCVVCHGADAQGLIGPNLTDAFWIHGDRPSDIYKIISGGVAAKGMPAWESILGGEKSRWLAAYVTTLKGKNLPGRAPEGTKTP